MVPCSSHPRASLPLAVTLLSVSFIASTCSLALGPKAIASLNGSLPLSCSSPLLLVSRTGGCSLCFSFLLIAICPWSLRPVVCLHFLGDCPQVRSLPRLHFSSSSSDSSSLSKIHSLASPDDTVRQWFTCCCPPRLHPRQASHRFHLEHCPECSFKLDSDSR